MHTAKQKQSRNSVNNTFKDNVLALFKLQFILVLLAPNAVPPLVLGAVNIFLPNAIHDFGNHRCMNIVGSPNEHVVGNIKLQGDEN